jgi:hypothetical protein
MPKSTQMTRNDFGPNDRAKLLNGWRRVRSNGPCRAEGDDAERFGTAYKERHHAADEVVVYFRFLLDGKFYSSLSASASSGTFAPLACPQMHIYL